MPTIALHRLTDWPTFRHLQPLLTELGIGGAILDSWHFFYAESSVEEYPFTHIPKVGAATEHNEALFALSEVYATDARQLVDATEDDLILGFHWSASKEELVAAAKKAGLHVVFVADLIDTVPPTAEHLPPLYTTWEATALRAMLKDTLVPASVKLAQRYVDEGGALPALTLREGASKRPLEYYFGFADWTARHERALDVFVAATEQRVCPVWNVSAEGGLAYDDSAGRLRDALATRNVPDTVVFDALCKEPEPGSSQVAFGQKNWSSRHALLAGWFARLDEVAAMGPGRAAALFLAQTSFPRGLRVLAAIVSERWCRAGGFARLDLPALTACSHLDQHENAAPFHADAGQVFTARVLALPAPTLSELVSVSWHGVPERGAQKRRFDEAVRAAAERDEATLLEWQAAKSRGLITDAMFAKGIVPAFRRALAAGLRTPPHGFGDQEGFAIAAPTVGAADPDLCLRGFVALTRQFNERGQKNLVEEWDRLVPKRGFSRAALAEATAHFSSPARRSSAKILAKLLSARGIEITQTKPPALDAIDQVFQVGTDVAHLLVGGYEAVESVADEEDPDDWPAAIKKHKCIGLETGADGQYTVRVVGAAAGANVTTIARAKAKGATHVATFPFQIKGDALTVSGIVGAGGTPTIAFPSGVYAAEVFATKGGAVTVVVAKVKTTPKWTFKNDLPHL